MTDDLGTILDEILSVKKSLREVAEDALEERIELRDRLHELHAAAAVASQDASTESTLRRYLTQLERRREALLGQRIDPSWQDGGVGGLGIPGNQIEGFNRRIDDAVDLPALEKEIERIRARLATDAGD